MVSAISLLLLLFCFDVTSALFGDLTAFSCVTVVPWFKTVGVHKAGPISVALDDDLGLGTQGRLCLRAGHGSRLSADTT